MKLTNLFIALAATIALYSCGGSDKPAETSKIDSMAAVTYTINPDSSTVTWSGTMLKVYTHTGTVKLKSGSVTVVGGKVTTGTFTVDLKSINPLDSNYNTTDHKKEGLVGHLSSPEFFATDSFPEATFAVKSIDGSTVTGDLTVRGKTNEEKVTDVVITADSTSFSATGKLVFNRQKYGIAWKAAKKDMVLSDDIEISVALKGRK
jgi:polyisoprenoid-binding protein YceI